MVLPTVVTRNLTRPNGSPFMGSESQCHGPGVCFVFTAASRLRCVPSRSPCGRHPARTCLGTSRAACPTRPRRAWRGDARPWRRPAAAPVAPCGRRRRRRLVSGGIGGIPRPARSEEHTSELQSHHDLVCRLLLEKKKKRKK